MAIERRAHATWEGDLRGGAGHFDLTSSNAITGQEVTFASRFEQPGGKTSPEELISCVACDVLLDGARRRARTRGPSAHEARDRCGLHGRL